MFKARELLGLEIPPSLRRLGYPPKTISVAGDFSPAPLCVAIVGSRNATDASIQHAHRLAACVVVAGGVVISGGANGTDAAAHRGAIDAGGRTWCVQGCGSEHVWPPHDKIDDKDRWRRILDHGGAILWPFPPDEKAIGHRFKKRNRVIMALADLAIIVQAGEHSGTRSAAEHAKALGKPVWVVPGLGKEFAGNWLLIREGARLIRSEEELIECFVKSPFDAEAQRVLNVLGSQPKHPDEIAVLTGLSTPAVTTALLTLALGDVVVEGSAGLYSRK